MLGRAQEIARQLACRIGGDADDGNPRMERRGDHEVADIQPVVFVRAVANEQARLLRS